MPKNALKFKNFRSRVVRELRSYRRRKILANAQLLANVESAVVKLKVKSHVREGRKKSKRSIKKMKMNRWKRKMAQMLKRMKT